MNEEIPLQKLESMTQEEFYAFFDSICDDQAVDSDFGGDLDTDDLLLFTAEINFGTSSSSKVLDEEGQDESTASSDIIPPSVSEGCRLTILSLIHI